MPHRFPVTEPAGKAAHLIDTCKWWRVGGAAAFTSSLTYCWMIRRSLLEADNVCFFLSLQVLCKSGLNQ